MSTWICNFPEVPKSCFLWVFKRIYKGVWRLLNTCLEFAKLVFSILVSACWRGLQSSSNISPSFLRRERPWKKDLQSFFSLILPLQRGCPFSGHSPFDTLPMKRNIPSHTPIPTPSRENAHSNLLTILGTWRLGFTHRITQISRESTVTAFFHKIYSNLL